MALPERRIVEQRLDGVCAIIGLWPRHLAPPTFPTHDLTNVTENALYYRSKLAPKLELPELPEAWKPFAGEPA